MNAQPNTKPVYTVTLQTLREKGACYDGYNRVVRMLQGLPFTREDRYRTSYIPLNYEEPISLIDIAKNNGLDDALWCLRCIPGCKRDTRLFAVSCARQVEHLMTDRRSLKALDVAEAYANGEATKEELEEAKKTAKAAKAAYWIAYRNASHAADAAYWATSDAGSAAGAAAQAAYRAVKTSPNTAKATIRLEMFVVMLFIAMCEGRAPWQV